MAETTPITLLTGFLGAGKTTLLNHLLRQPEFARTAVLVNEYGEVGLDHLLVEKLSDTTILLNAGCICCSVRGDLVRALRDMLPRARRDDISRIVIETTGLADPIPILTTLLTDPVAAAAYRLDGIVTVIDAVNGPMHLDTQQEARLQVAVADRIIISKSDLADPAPLAARLHDLNPAAAIGHGLPCAAFVIGAGLPRNPEAWLTLGDDHHHHHDDGIDTYCVTLPGRLEWPAVAAWLEELVAFNGAHLLRLKGILNLQDHDRPVAIHAVRHLLHPPTKMSRWPDDDIRDSRIVLITTGLPRAAIDAGLAKIRQPAMTG